MFAKRNDLGSLQIVDFGLSAQYRRPDAQILTDKCGTGLFMAPEVYFNYTYSKASPLGLF